MKKSVFKFIRDIVLYGKDLKSYQRSFTLIELLVAVAVFSLILGAASGIFISAIRTQRKALAFQETLDQTSYVMEYMSRALRMAKKDIDGDCTGAAKLNYSKADSGIKFENYNDECQEFFRVWDAVNEVNRLKEVKAVSEDYLTSPNLNVVSFNIGPSDSWDQNDDDQPRVTIFLRIKGAGEKPEQQPVIKIQTTVSQRNLDIKY